MDALLSALVTKLPELGIAGLALMLLLTSWRNATTDRGDYRDALRAAEERHAAEIERLNRAHAAEIERINREHDAEIAEIRATKADLRKRIDDLNVALDLEREARRSAEDRIPRAVRRRGESP